MSTFFYLKILTIYFFPKTKNYLLPPPDEELDEELELLDDELLDDELELLDDEPLDEELLDDDDLDDEELEIVDDELFVGLVEDELLAVDEEPGRELDELVTEDDDDDDELLDPEVVIPDDELEDVLLFLVDVVVPELAVPLFLPDDWLLADEAAEFE